jgi:hypothetical protein
VSQPRLLESDGDTPKKMKTLDARMASISTVTPTLQTPKFSPNVDVNIR